MKSPGDAQRKRADASGRLLRFGVLLLAVSRLFAQAEVIEVDDLDGLGQYLDDDGVNIRMLPGTYLLNTATSTNFLEFTGSDAHFDFTGVKLEVDTTLLTQFNDGINMLYMTGDHILLEGLELETVGTNYASGGCRAISFIGDSITLSNLSLRLAGSYPYGYGSLFGIGAGASINPKKMNGIRVGGVNAQVMDCRVIMRGFGHGIFIRGGQNVLIKDCYVEGALRKTDDILAETSGPAFDQGFIQYTGEPIPPGQMISLSEDGIREYPDDPFNNNRRTRDITLENCRIVRMRKGVAMSNAGGTNRVENCDAIESERVGFHIGPKTTVRDCRSDALYTQRGVLDLDPGSHSADVEIAVLNSREHYGNHRLAEIAGSDHRVVLTEFEPGAVPQSLAIGLGTHYGENAAANNVELHNLTPAPVLVSPLAESCIIESLGLVYDVGQTPVPPPNGLLLRLKLDDGTGLVAADATPNGFDGSLEGFLSDDSQWISGYSSGGLWFEPGVEGNVFSAMTVAVTNLPPISNTTWAAWARIDSDPNTHGCVMSSDTQDSHGHNLGFDQNGNIPRTLWNHNDGTTTLIADQPVDTNWNHLAVTYDWATTTLRLYVNGALADESTEATSKAFDRINLGRRGNQQLAYRGGIDEVLVYDRALDASEIAQLAGPDTNGPPEVLLDPVSMVVWEGETVQFNVEAGGTEPIGFQWYHDDVAIVGATSTVYSITGVTPADAGSYSIVRTFSAGTVTSATAVLAVRPILSIGQDLPPWVSASGLVLYWNLDEVSQYAAWDRSGNNHHGALEGFPFDGSYEVPELIGGGIQFYPADQEVRVEVSGLPVLSNTTWAVWTRLLGDQVNNATVLSSTFGGAVQGHSLGFSSGVTARHGRTLWNHGALQTSVLDLQPVNETWNHLALTYHAGLGTLTLYVNGQAVGSDWVEDFEPFSSLNVGRREASGTQQLAGMVDEVLVYDRVMSAGEIQSLYEDSLVQGAAPLREVGVRIESNEQSGPEEMAMSFRTFWPNQAHEIRGKTNLTDPSWQTVGGAVLRAENVEVFRATVPIEAQASGFLSAVALPGAAIFSEDFEDGAAGWTHGGLNDNWELGTPTSGPGAAHSGSNVYATGLAGDYNPSSDMYLRSPSIDLSGVTSARLHFWEYRDIFPAIDFHRGTINILEARTLTEIDDIFRVSGANGGWTEWYVDLPDGAYGTNIAIEFQVEADPFDPRPGWYIDDVEILPY